MTPTETRQIFGDSFAGKFFNGSDYTDVTFRYSGVTSVYSSGWVDPDNYMVAGRDVIVYSAGASGVNSNANYITVDVQPEYSLFDFNVLYTAIGVSNSYSQNISAFQSPFWRWHIGGEDMSFEGNGTVDENGVFPKIVLRDNTARQYSLCPVKYQSQSLTSGYSLRAGFYGASTFSGSLYIYIACPYITDGASGITGTFTTATTQQGGIDMSGVESGIQQTNDVLEEHTGLLGRIIDFLQYIGESIHGDESEVSEVEPIETMENPPDWDDAMSQVESALDDVPDVTASGGFIWALYNSIMTTSPVIKFLVPFGLVITLLSYIWWKK